MLEKLVNATGSHLGTYPENELFDVGAVAKCLGQFMEKSVRAIDFYIFHTADL